MTIVADIVDAVIGADTHRDSHALQLRSPAGRVLAETEVPNSDAGFAAAAAWAAAHAPGPRIAAGIEGTRSYGIGLARALADAAIPVVEVQRPARRARGGKSDPIDAGLAAAAALAMDAAELPQPRADGEREALRILLAARNDMARLATARSNALRALLLTGGDPDRALARGRLPAADLRGIAARRGPRAGESVPARVRRRELARLARSLLDLRAELAANSDELAAITAALAPGLLDAPGVGPVTAARVAVAWSHPGRCRDDAAFASLAGACPLPASSGRTIRHRLNRGGDRSLNQALHQIAITRARCHQPTIDYIARRRAEGRTDKEIRRCLKRYIARQLHNQLTRTWTADPTTAPPPTTG
jgi:transposase